MNQTKFTTILLATTVFFLFLSLASISLANTVVQTVQQQLVQILIEEAKDARVKIGIFPFNVSYMGKQETIDAKMKSLSETTTESFISALFQEIRAKGAKDKIAIIERSQLEGTSWSQA